MPLFILLFWLIGLNFWLTAGADVASERGVVGGPVQAAGGAAQGGDAAVLEGLSPTFIKSPEDITADSDIAGFVLLDGATLANSGSLLGGALTRRDGLLVYKTQSGDNLSKIAGNFGISTDTILWANGNLKKGRPIKTGTEIIILPVSGITYKTQPGDTLQSVSAAYGADAGQIRAANRLSTFGELVPGTTIVIPGGKPKKSLTTLASLSDINLPNLPGYFDFPTEKNSWNWGKLHPNNAVDIANACGTPIYAAAEGMVSEVGDPDNWNGGYGGFVKIEHPNGTETLYAHTESNLVSEGDLVSKGGKIAEIGRTGNTHGPTGCHVHFEVHNAKNPFAK